MSISLWLERLRGWDEAGFYLINRSLQNPFFDLLMPFVSNKWNFALPVAVLLGYILLFRPKRDRIIALSTIAVILLTDETSQLLKDLFERTRPFHPLRDITRPVSFSFPSNHASNMFALAVFLSYNYSRSGWLCFPVAALVGYSRIYVGSHYPFDVLGGALWGVMVGLLGAVAVRRLMRMAGARHTSPAGDEKDRPAGEPETFQ
ncbi:MAG: phosphatase PAP2 family protein [Candidatus Methylomirabilis oxygeniifera]|uniref:Putative Membrane-associated phospholipid phosphatase n=1 Tax=Methylomirabilis oxygeniifera TaxID=671143 RepID=D5MG13_METO1|nr:MAG: phosphatase PAP2 family protein [Candidatus Methylomirabilis oxyfera]CBE68694.1 putative Membrane-associated phospholipid phosphatase [Candidatus Methylomirabilis oxyfera]